MNALAQGAIRRFTQWRWVERPTFHLGGGQSTTELPPAHSALGQATAEFGRQRERARATETAQRKLGWRQQRSTFHCVRTVNYHLTNSHVCDFLTNSSRIFENSGASLK